MHIAEIAAGLEVNHLYRCDSMPAGRAFMRLSIDGEEGVDLYVRKDGSTEPFDWMVDGGKYNLDESWRDLGQINPKATGEIRVFALGLLLR